MPLLDMVYNDSTGAGLGRENILQVDNRQVLGGAKEATNFKDTSSDDEERRCRPYNKLQVSTQNNLVKALI